MAFIHEYGKNEVVVLGEKGRKVSARPATREESVVCSCVVLLCCNEVLLL